MAAIIVTHRGRKEPNWPGSIAPPMSIPFICRTATTQDAAASPSVAANAAVVAVLALPMAVGRGIAQNGYSSLRQARGSSGCGFGVRSSSMLKKGCTNGSGAETV